MTALSEESGALGFMAGRIWQSYEEYGNTGFSGDAVRLVPAVTCLVAVSLEEYKTVGFLGRRLLVRCLCCLKSTRLLH